MTHPNTPRKADPRAALARTGGTRMPAAVAAPPEPSAMALMCSAVLAAQLQGRVGEATARAWASNIDREPPSLTEADWYEAARRLARNPPERIGYADWLELARRARDERLAREEEQARAARPRLEAHSQVERFRHASEPLAPWLVAKLDGTITGEEYDEATQAILRGDAVPAELRRKARIGGGEEQACGT